MDPYECDPIEGCGGGFGGANDLRSGVGAGRSGAPGYSWAVEGIPFFSGTQLDSTRPVPSEFGTSLIGPSPVTTANVLGPRTSTQTTLAGTQVAPVSQPNWIVPLLIILGALALSR